MLEEGQKFRYSLLDKDVSTLLVADCANRVFYVVEKQKNGWWSVVYRSYRAKTAVGLLRVLPDMIFRTGLDKVVLWGLSDLEGLKPYNLETFKALAAEHGVRQWV